MLKILQARLQQYMNHELPDVQAGFRKGRGTRGQIANILWIMEKAREFQKNIVAVQGTLKSLLQHHSSKASILWCSAFFTVQLSHPYMTTGETIERTSGLLMKKVSV